MRVVFHTAFNTFGIEIQDVIKTCENIPNLFGTIFFNIWNSMSAALHDLLECVNCNNIKGPSENPQYDSAMMYGGF